MLILPPFYFDGIENAGLIDFFKKSLEGLSKPIYLYNFPRHVKIGISPHVFKEVAAVCENIAGIKDSGGDFAISQGLQQAVSGLDVLVGDDSLALQVLKTGLAGSVTGAGNPFPEFLVGLAAAWLKGEFARAEEIQRGFDEWNNFRKTLRGHEISIVKYTLGLRLAGFPSQTRAPLLELAHSEKLKIQNSLEGLLRLADSVKLG